MYAQVIVSAMSALNAALPMTEFTRGFRHARIGITTTAAAETATPSADPDGWRWATTPPNPTTTR